MDVTNERTAMSPPTKQKTPKTFLDVAGFLATPPQTLCLIYGALVLS